MEAYNLIQTDGEALYYPHFFSEKESKEYFNLLQEQLHWQRKQINLFGKTYWQPRLIAWYADPNIQYSYSGTTLEAKSWVTPLLNIKKKLAQIDTTLFNSVLANLYRDGQDSMGWHSDDEKELGKNPTIASISFGGTRRFHFRHKHNKSIKNQSIDLQSGSLLLMKGALQHCWQHQISKTKKTVQARINLTFRKIL